MLSPGPCTPQQAGRSLPLVRELHTELPILGVCLGHQTIAEALGGRIVRAREPVHGRSFSIRHDGRGLFLGLPETFPAARYHSLAAVEIPDCFEICARTADCGEPMAVRHKERPLFGLQFHPESFLTERGCDLLQNFLESAP